MSGEKRCYYEVLNLPQTCTQEEIKSSYKKLALLRHPDKLILNGATSSDATSSFQELRHAYEVLSDPKERSWYDSHRSQILFSDFNSVDVNNSKDSFTNLFPDLFSYFSATCYTDYSDTGKGFYKVYGDLFNRVYANEVNYCRKLGLGLGLGFVKEAPVIGGLGSDYGQVTAFYGYWGGFVTVMDFGWVSKWDAKAGGDRRTRRVMEEENKKVRKKARREFNETVRGLAEFVKKRDKRVIEMGVRKEKERERRREEEVERRKERERERARTRAFEGVEEEVEDVEEEVEEETEMETETEEKRELYCEVCGKKFKSEKQWMNHEKSRKHKDRVAELRRIFEEEDGLFEGVGVDVDVSENGDDDGDVRENVSENGDDDGDVRENGDDDGDVREDVGVNGVDDGDEEVREDVEVKGADEEGDVDDGFLSAEDADDFGEGFRVGDEKGTVKVGSDEEDELNEKFKECVGLEKGKGKAKVVSDDEEANGGDEQRKAGSDEDVSVLEAMLSGRRGGKRVSFKDETEVMEYNNKKVKKKSRRAKKDKGKSDGSTDAGENSKATGSSNVSSDGDEDDDHRRGRGGKKAAERKSKRDAESKAKNSSKGRKQKEKDTDIACEKCGEEFDSRNQLYKHLSDTGHASLKSR